MTAVDPSWTDHRLRASLVTLAAALLVVTPVPASLDDPAVPALGVAALGGLLAGLWPRSTWTRGAATLGLIALVVQQGLAHPLQPARGMFLGIGLVGLSTLLWPSVRLLAFDATRREPALWEPAAIAGFAGLLGWFAPAGGAAASPWALTTTYLVALVVIGRAEEEPSWTSRALEGVALLFAFVPLLDLVIDGGRSAAALGTLSPWLLAARHGARTSSFTFRRAETWIDTLLVDPSRLLVLSFAAISLFGTLALSLPVSVAEPGGLSLLDAAFTSVSATCVTGLSVVDTPTAFTGFGEFVVLVLIQIGGLGIMVLSTSAAVILGERLSLRYERTAVALVGASSRASLADTVRDVLLLMGVTEGVAALVLFVRFLTLGDSAGQAAWRAVFTAVSAFCNAGFALQSDSLVSYAEDPFVMVPVGLAIVLGGLGPAIVFGFLTWRRTPHPSLHVSLGLVTTALLIGVPALMFAVIEADGVLADHSGVGRLGQGLFHSVTLRTAGFAALDLSAMRPASLLVMLVLMFIGGSPASTAGGIKTTTIAVLALAALAGARGREAVTVFGRTLPPALVQRAVTVAALAMGMVLAGLGALLLTQDLPFEMALFETVSAVGTVGLSIGGTARLDEIGKVVIITCMFAGRVGPLSLLSFLVSDGRRRVRHTYPRESVPVG